MPSHPMLRLANELLRSIAGQLESEKDVNALARTNSSLFSCLDPFLYRHNMQQSGSSALRWAALHGQGRTARKAIDAGSEGIGEALGLSAENGHEEVTRILLAIDGVDGDSRDERGRRPLSRAAAKGHDQSSSFSWTQGRLTSIRGTMRAVHHFHEPHLGDPSRSSSSS
ncbi:hypothetical protein B0J13DRAFT_64326 [Dactylonectria estremocensis]|uniref:Uncharacterized protein n=1 Tax=Dactylonectria estremocensis TaxID=1079267 RepID=A0A9P9J228_9HYPO|nr:hypothetical protein B0J13DRAFT_64326 [Dactylonectria estremocensis]